MWNVLVQETLACVLTRPFFWPDLGAVPRTVLFLRRRRTGSLVGDPGRHKLIFNMMSLCYDLDQTATAGHFQRVPDDLVVIATPDDG